MKKSLPVSLVANNWINLKEFPSTNQDVSQFQMNEFEWIVPNDSGATIDLGFRVDNCQQCSVYLDAVEVIGCDSGSVPVPPTPPAPGFRYNVTNFFIVPSTKTSFLVQNAR